MARSPVVLEDLNVAVNNGDTNQYDLGKLKQIAVNCDTGQVAIHFYNEDGTELTPKRTVKAGFPFEYNWGYRKDFPDYIKIEGEQDSSEYDVVIERTAQA